MAATLAAGERATPEDVAILRTVTYAGLFQFPLSLEELQRTLMDVPLGRERLQVRLAAPYLRARLSSTEGFVHPAGREAWVGVRRARAARTRELVARHQTVLRLLARLPFVRLLALSGACSRGNAADADVDVFLVTQTGRAWSVYLLAVLLSRLLGVRRSLCLNYVLDLRALELPEQDVFTAAEVVGLQPLAGPEGYRRFVAANPWVAEHFPNYWACHAGEVQSVPVAGGPRWLETLLLLGPAQALEGLARLTLGPRLRRKSEGRPGVALSPHRLKLHLLDHAPRLRSAYELALDEAPW